MFRNSVKKAAVVGALSAAGLLATLPSPAQAASGFTVRVEPESNPFLFLDVNGGATGDGAQIIQWSLSGDNQIWTFQPSGSHYQIVNRRSGKCITSDGLPGTPLYQWRCKGTALQQWDTSLTPSTGLAYSIRNVGSGLFMEVSGDSGAQGTAIDTWYWNGGLNQYFLGTTAY
ncbi:hypothetical protein Acor_08000 [Acrocarpospora corrugata]|uniref:Ricin B lectin domain-containing protein n=1 Tax=Acrocarpospora corrugata TaxID=35763 RepID=A0A5M3VWG1_9ACTN|nr:RICIN domain-containing protein [Acrocarpospora corrugata]GER98737.1 hypothetical protein Acor_08000 [Acrocarpospora corrugata]